MTTRLQNVTEEHLMKVSAGVVTAIQKARSSPVRLGYIDLFVGPLVGRHTMVNRLESLALEIGRGVEFQPNQAVLAVHCDYGPANGKLLLIGGGHRLLVCARQILMMFLPYQVVDFSDLQEGDSSFDIKQNEGFIAHHVESSESRPHPYGLMQQVSLYGKLKSNWWRLQKQRMKALGIPRSKRPAMTHKKLWHLYKLTTKATGDNSKNAICFLESRISEKARSQYMSGADRLLKADIVEELCVMESVHSVKFGVTSLSTVRLWSIQKIKDTVLHWVSIFNDGKIPKCKFSIKKSRKVVSNERGRKISDRDKQVKPPTGWESYIDWSRPLSLDLIDELRKKLSNEDSDGISTTGDNVHVIEDNHDMILVVDRVREKVERESRNGVRFDLAVLIGEECLRVEEENRLKNGLVVDGGVYGVSSRLLPDHISCIEKLYNANDQSLLFTLNFLNNWTDAAIRNVYVQDPLLTKGWWDKPFRSNDNGLKTIQSTVSSYTQNPTNNHELVWRKHISLIFLCGMDHWTLCVVLNLPSLFNVFEEREHPNSKRPLDISHGAKVIIFDSLKDSPHACLTPNILRYLHSAYPGKQSLSYTALCLNLKVHEHRQKLQKKRECGFYCTYFAALVAMNIHVFRNGTISEILQFVENATNRYSFTQYSDEIHTRLRLMRSKYKQRRRTAIKSNIFYWPLNGFHTVVVDDDVKLVSERSTLQISDLQGGSDQAKEEGKSAAQREVDTVDDEVGNKSNSPQMKQTAERTSLVNEDPTSISLQLKPPTEQSKQNNGAMENGVAKSDTGQNDAERKDTNSIAFIVEEGNNIK